MDPDNNDTYDWDADDAEWEDAIAEMDNKMMLDDLLDELRPHFTN